MRPSSKGGDAVGVAYAWSDITGAAIFPQRLRLRCGRASCSLWAREGAAC